MNNNTEKIMQDLSLAFNLGLVDAFVHDSVDAYLDYKEFKQMSADLFNFAENMSGLYETYIKGFDSLIWQ